MLYNLLANNKKLFIKVISECRIPAREINNLYKRMTSKVPSYIKRWSVTRTCFGKEPIKLSIQNMMYIMIIYYSSCPPLYSCCDQSCAKCREDSITKLLEDSDSIDEVVRMSKDRYGK